MLAQHFRDSAMNASPAWELERYLPLLRVYARQLQLDPKLRRCFGESDLVQEALVRALRGLAECRAPTEAEFVAWLRTILRHTAIDLGVAAKALKRYPGFLQSLDGILNQSSIRLGQFLADRGPSPS